MKKFLLVNFLLFLIIHSFGIYSQSSFNSLIDNGNTRFAAGQFSEAAGLYEEAITLLKTELQKAVSENQNQQIFNIKRIITHAWAQLIKCRVELDEYQKAHDAYFEAVKTLPDSDDYRLHDAGAVANYYLGNIAFADGNFPEALVYYKKVKTALSKNNQLPKRTFWFGKTWFGIDTVMDALNIRMKLGNIRPKYVQKVLTVFIKHIKLLPEDDGYGKIPNMSLSEQTISREWLNSRLLVRLVEALTLGNISIDMRKAVLDTTITRLFYLKESPTDDRMHPYWEYLSPAQDGFHQEHIPNTDVFIYHWPHLSGLPARENFLHYPFVPFQVYGPHRRHTLLPLGTITEAKFHNWALKLHEFFHTMEAAWGIKHVHGFLKSERRHYPDWRGTTNDQWDFYKWITANYIFPRAEQRVPANERKNYHLGWKMCAFSERYPVRVTEEQIAYSREKLKDISFANREKAFKLTQLGHKEWWKGNKEESHRLFVEARQLNPFNLDVLKYFANLAIRNREHDKALSFIQEYLKHSPDWSLAIEAGNIYAWHKNSLTEAEKFYQFAFQTLNEPEEQAEVYLRWGYALTSKSKWEEAGKLFYKGTHFDTRPAIQCRFHYGEMLFRTGQKQEGIKWMKEAMILNKHIREWFSEYFKRLTR